MNRNTIIKPWDLNFKAFFMSCVFLFITINSEAQNVLEKTITADKITTISINGNQIFNISVSTSKTDEIIIRSTLDGEYQNDFQIVIKEESQTLKLNLEHLSLLEIPDDKRNAHKVIAATLHMEIPEELSLHIVSDIGSVDVKGNFKLLFIELLQGQCQVEGDVKTANINTLDGDINAATKNAFVNANSRHGTVVLGAFSSSKSIWKLKSTNGNITVVKLD